MKLRIPFFALSFTFSLLLSAQSYGPIDPSTLTFSASAQPNGSPAYNWANLIDGDYNTSWSTTTAASPSDYLLVQIDQPIEITQLAITAGIGGGYTYTYNIEFQLTNGSWQSLGNATFNSESTETFFSQGSPQLMTAIRINNIQSIATYPGGSSNVPMNIKEIYLEAEQAIPSITGGLTVDKLQVGAALPVNDYLVAVGGNIICEGVDVMTRQQWPDYVFDKDHKLMTLKETEDYISENGHLPGVPDAETVRKKGISLDEMIIIQMEKIEELTLHIIELQKQIKVLQTEKR